jgi:hypothetical protein
MALYELRTYTLHVRKMAEAVKLYQEISGNSMMTPTVARIGPLCTQTGICRGFRSKFRPLLMIQEAKLLQATPWGPHP